MSLISRQIARTSQPQELNVRLAKDKPAILDGLLGFIDPINLKAEGSASPSPSRQASYSVIPTGSGLATNTTSANQGVTFTLPSTARDTFSVVVMAHAVRLVTGVHHPIIRRYSTADQGGFDIALSQYGTGDISAGAYYYPDFNGNSSLTATSVVSVGSRFMLVYTFKRNATSKLYVNGLLRASGGTTNFAASFSYGSTSWTLGGSASGINPLYALVYDRELSAAEVLSLSNNPWQIFEPRIETLWFDMGASGGVPATASGSFPNTTITASGANAFGFADAVGSISSIQTISTVAIASAGATGIASGNINSIIIGSPSASSNASVSVSGSINSVGIESPNASVSASGIASGSIDSIALASPNVSVSGSGIAFGNINSVLIESPNASGGAIGIASGVCRAIVLTNTLAQASGKSRASGSIAALSLISPLGQSSGKSLVSGNIAALNLVSPSVQASGKSRASGSIAALSLIPSNGQAFGGTLGIASGGFPAIVITTPSTTSGGCASVSGQFTPIGLVSTLGGRPDDPKRAFTKIKYTSHNVNILTVYSAVNIQTRSIDTKSHISAYVPWSEIKYTTPTTKIKNTYVI